jgi:pimeloyl-ACP methyl ester carboxylesterase
LTDNLRDRRPDRRSLIVTLGLLGVAGLASSAQAGGSDATMRVPVPAQVPATEGLAQLKDVKLWYSDTGGNGPAVVFLHAGTGSGRVWLYQQPAFAKAGYRVITYSRRGYAGSDAGPKDNPGSGADDLLQLMDFLKIDKFHAVGLAAGAITAMDFAFSYPQRLLSLVQACTIMGLTDESYLAMSNGLRPKGFNEMPSEFREISASYRAANPEGTKKWVELEHAAIHERVAQRRNNRVTLEALKTMKVPTLLITGDADLYTPPSVLRMFAERIPNNEAHVIAEAGHSVYWEQPEEFNRLVLAFVAKHK